MYYSFPAFARLATVQRTSAPNEMKREEDDAAYDEQAPPPASMPLPATALE
jgi:hypothetical protein